MTEEPAAPTPSNDDGVPRKVSFLRSVSVMGAGSLTIGILGVAVFLGCIAVMIFRRDLLVGHGGFGNSIRIVAFAVFFLGSVVATFVGAEDFAMSRDFLQDAGSAFGTSGRLVDRARLQSELAELNAAVDESAKEADRLQKIIENYRKQASDEFRQAAADLLGEESAATVAGHFTNFAGDLTWRHRRARMGAIVSLVVGSLLVGSLLLYGAEHGFDTQLLLAKVSISVPFGVLFATLYLESNQYRQEALIAANISVQMRSVAAYTIWLDQESKDAVRRKLGEAIFVGPPAHLLRHSKASENETLPTDVVLHLLGALLPQAATQSGSGSTRRV